MKGPEAMQCHVIHGIYLGKSRDRKQVRMWSRVALSFPEYTAWKKASDTGQQSVDTLAYDK